jgi:hypothetical protein
MDYQTDPNSLPPVGLLGLFQIKSAGATPRPMLDLQFNFAADEFYFRAIEQVRTLQNTFAAVGGIGLSSVAANDTVPQGKLWMITGINIRAVTLVAEIARFKLALIPIPGQVLALGMSGTSSLTDAAGIGVAAVGIEKPILVGPGYRIGAMVEKVTTAGSITLNTDMRFIEFPA